MCSGMRVKINSSLFVTWWTESWSLIFICSVVSGLEMFSPACGVVGGKGNFPVNVSVTYVRLSVCQCSPYPPPSHYIAPPPPKKELRCYPVHRKNRAHICKGDAWVLFLAEVHKLSIACVAKCFGWQRQMWAECINLVQFEREINWSAKCRSQFGAHIILGNPCIGTLETALVDLCQKWCKQHFWWMQECSYSLYGWSEATWKVEPFQPMDLQWVCVCVGWEGCIHCAFTLSSLFPQRKNGSYCSFFFAPVDLTSHRTDFFLREFVDESSGVLPTGVNAIISMEREKSWFSLWRSFMQEFTIRPWCLVLDIRARTSAKNLFGMDEWGFTQEDRQQLSTQKWLFLFVDHRWREECVCCGSRRGTAGRGVTEHVLASSHTHFWEGRIHWGDVHDRNHSLLAHTRIEMTFRYKKKINK